MPKKLVSAVRVDRQCARGDDRPRRNRRLTFADRMFAVVDDLLAEFPELPLLTVLDTINGARHDLTGPAGDPEPELVGTVARQRLQKLHRTG